MFQECGKCGANAQRHIVHGSPMGVLCQLTVSQGAKVGAASSYRRKLMELAARADLQKELKQENEQQQQAQAQEQEQEELQQQRVQ